MKKLTVESLAGWLVILAVGLLVGGVYVLAGLGWTLLAAGVLFLVIAVAALNGSKNEVKREE